MVQDAGWRLSVYPDAGEASGSFRYSWSAPRSPSSGRGDPERSRAEAARRARSKLRRYCAANRLNRLGTLTYRGAGCHDPLELRSHVAGFWRGLRGELGGDAFPYAWVSEWHKTDHGLHVHFVLPRYVHWTLVRDTWGRGNVFMNQINDVPVGAGARGEARIAARYLAKYVGKDFDDRRVEGLHRYEVAQGFQPEVTAVYGRTMYEALDRASDVFDSPPDQVVELSQREDWQGPPAVWASWR